MLPSEIMAQRPYNAAIARLVNDLAKPTYVLRMNSANGRPSASTAYNKAAKEIESIIRKWVEDNSDAVA